MGICNIFTASLGCLLLSSTAKADLPHYTDAAAYNAGHLGDAPNQTFHSSPIIAPHFLVNHLDPSGIDPAAPYLFLEFRYNNISSPMIFRSDDLSLVYADQTYIWTKNTRAQTIRGEPHLTFWEGAEAIRYGNGHCLVFDQGYNLKYNVTPIGLESGRKVDLHECQFTEEGNALISIYESLPDYDLSPMGGEADGVLLDNLFQEIDPETNELLFEWRASDYFGLEGSAATIANNSLPHGFDFYHLNSLEKRNGNYLVGGRSFSHVLLVNGTDGSIIWTLGGPDNEFKDLSGGRATDFFAQHQPRFRADDENTITLFDNAFRNNIVDCTSDCSRGLEVRLDYEAMTAEVVAEYFHPMGLQSIAQGGMVVLEESGNALIGWGTQAGVTEHRGGEVVMDIQIARIVTGWFPDWNAVYRAYKMDWDGKPSWNPSIAVVDGTVYLSWNGATALAGWVVIGSDGADTIGDGDDGEPRVLAKSERKGFETAVLLEGEIPAYLQAQAVDSQGNIIGSTAVWNAETGEAVTATEEAGIKI